MTSPDTTADGDDSGTAPAGPGGAERATSARPPATRRYVAVIAAGLVVAGASLAAGLVLAARGASPSNGLSVGSGARPVPQQSVTAPPATSLAPDSPPAVMGDHVAGDPTAAFYLRAADQPGDGRSVVVEDVTFSKGSGWIVVHADAGNAPGPILGVSSEQPAGDHVNVIVTLKAPLVVSSNLFVMLHTEDNGDSTFDYPQSDQPAQLNGQVVMVPIYLQVE